MGTLGPTLQGMYTWPLFPSWPVHSFLTADPRGWGEGPRESELKAKITMVFPLIHSLWNHVLNQAFFQETWGWCGVLCPHETHPEKGGWQTRPAMS